VWDDALGGEGELDGIPDAAMDDRTRDVALECPCGDDGVVADAERNLLGPPVEADRALGGEGRERGVVPPQGNVR
jgi:hypothetical protein